MGNKIVAWTINACFVGFLLWRIAAINNDKAILLFYAYYPVFVFLNLGTWLSLWIFGNQNYKVYKYTSIALLVLALPLFWIASRL